jgi:hypothetical protein
MLPWLAIAYLGHIQQRPGLDLPQLRSALLHWLTSPGLPAVEVFEVTSHLVWTHQTTNGPRQLLGATPTRSSLDPDSTPSGPSPVCCPSTTTQCSHTGAGGRGCHHLPWLLWLAVAHPVGEQVLGGLLALGCQ